MSPSSSPYPFDTQRATLKMEDMVDNFDYFENLN